MEPEFILKKLISMWLMPLPFCCLIILLGLGVSFWRVTIGRAIVSIGICLLMLFSWQPFADTVLYPMENNYPSFNMKLPVEAVVVLGNCHQVNDDIPPMAQLCGTGLYRLMEGYRIWLANPKAELFLSGYAGDESRPYAEIAAEIAVILGVPKSKIRLFPNAKDTQQEAELTAPFLKGKTLALVSSASHIQRSMAWFQQQKVDGQQLKPLAAPAQFFARQKSKNWKIETKALLKTERAWYETLGKAWAALNN